jgi:NAD(P)-dependent dehydrogenase (short-subunit alcohol dehydrogenase family)
VLTARTVTARSASSTPSTVKQSSTGPLPGSCEATAAECRALGAATHVAKLDLADRADWAPAIDGGDGTLRTPRRPGEQRRYVGPGHMDPFEETPLELIEQMFLCNVYAPLALIKLCLPIWKRQGGGIVINITSSAGQTETPQPIGKGGWGLGYSLTKAAFSRMVSGLAKELRPYNVAVIGLMPGLRRHGADGDRARPVRLRRVEGAAGREPRARVRDARDVDEPDALLGPRSPRPRSSTSSTRCCASTTEARPHIRSTAR